MHIAGLHVGAAVIAKPKPTPVRCAKGKVAKRVRVTIKVRRRFRSVVTGRMRTRPVRRSPDCSGSNISMDLREYSVTTTRGCVAAGSVNVDVLNFGQDPHNLALRPAAGGSPSWVLPGPDATSEVAAGDHLHQSVTIPAGKWIVYCSLPGTRISG